MCEAILITIERDYICRSQHCARKGGQWR